MAIGHKLVPRTSPMPIVALFACVAACSALLSTPLRADAVCPDDDSRDADGLRSSPAPFYVFDGHPLGEALGTWVRRLDGLPMMCSNGHVALSCREVLDFYSVAGTDGYVLAGTEIAALVEDFEAGEATIAGRFFIEPVDHIPRLVVTSAYRVGARGALVRVQHEHRPIGEPFCGDVLRAILLDASDDLFLPGDRGRGFSFVSTDGFGIDLLDVPHFRAVFAIDGAVVEDRDVGVELAPLLDPRTNPKSAARFRALAVLLAQQLVGLRAFAVEGRDTDIYLVGFTACGAISGIKATRARDGARAAECESQPR